MAFFHPQKSPLKIFSTPRHSQSLKDNRQLARSKALSRFPVPHIHKTLVQRVIRMDVLTQFLPCIAGIYVREISHSQIQFRYEFFLHRNAAPS